ncbi:MAG: AAA family ATPase [Myxococcales bacterium]|nr:AAA family ATPase [Myxococcales bacterium]
MGFSHIRAQEAAHAVLENALTHDKLAQAYLFVGPSGVGKQSTALSLARARLCEVRPGEGCGSCEVEKRIDDGTHPDVRIFTPRDEGNRNLQVEFVREELLPLTKFAPFEARATFLIFPEADVSFPVQHAESANALLKTLEEPRPAVHFLLLSERPDRLLPTIRSRCQRVRFSPLPADVLEDILAAHDVPAESRAPAIALCGGRADRALELAEEDLAVRMLDVAVAVDRAVGERKGGTLLELCESLARDEHRDIALESLSLYYRDVAAAALEVPDEQLAFRHRAELIRERARTLAPAVAAERVAAIAELGEALERNANPQVALEGLFFGMS